MSETRSPEEQCLRALLLSEDTALLSRTGPSLDVVIWTLLQNEIIRTHSALQILLELGEPQPDESKEIKRKRMTNQASLLGACISVLNPRPTDANEEVPS